MSKYDVKTEKQVLEQKICNIISYVIMLYRKGIISEKTKNDILRICNPDITYKVYNGSEQRWKRKR